MSQQSSRFTLEQKILNKMRWKAYDMILASAVMDCNKKIADLTLEIREREDTGDNVRERTLAEMREKLDLMIEERESLDQLVEEAAKHKAAGGAPMGFPSDWIYLVRMRSSD
jgi:hypothetical protein